MWATRAVNTSDCVLARFAHGSLSDCEPVDTRSQIYFVLSLPTNMLHEVAMFDYRIGPFLLSRSVFLDARLS